MTELKTLTLLFLGTGAVAIATRTAFLLLARKPVLAEVVGSSLPDETRYGHRRWQLARIGDALSAAEAPEPTESATIRVRYAVDGRNYVKELPIRVRRGDSAEPTQILWYDPADPSRVTDKGISWLGLGLAIGLFIIAAIGMR